jgi:hypothetical protein
VRRGSPSHPSDRPQPHGDHASLRPLADEANPDFVGRLETGAPLAEVDWQTVYGSGPEGYSDYPALQTANA